MSDALDMEPEITKQFVVAMVKDAFPGVKPKVVDRIGGVVVSVTTWQFTLEASLTTQQVGHADEAGFVGLRLVQNVKVSGGKSVPVQVIKTRTKSPAIVQAFVGRARAHLQGAAAALMAACDKQAPSDSDDVFGEFGDFDEGGA